MPSTRFDPTQLANEMSAPAATKSSIFGPSAAKTAAPPPEMKDTLGQVINELACAPQLKSGPYVDPSDRARLEDKLADALEKYTRVTGEPVYAGRDEALKDATKLFDQASAVAGRYAREYEPGLGAMITGTAAAARQSRDEFCAPVKENRINEQIERDSR